jgi:4-amino-4-deoxy-L-arabinose transferase-like glycosyltransferase
VQAAATWFNGTYTATRADLVAGVWILKGAIAVLALLALAIQRLTPPSPAPGDSRSRGAARSLAIAAVIVVLGLGLRLYRIDTELWLDEIELLVRYVPLEFRQLLSTYDSQNHQPLYTILARLSWLGAGGADWSVRLPAVVFGVAGLATIWSFGRRVASSSEATLAALVLAVSYHHVWFSQNARGYTAMLFFAVSATALFLRLCRGTERPSRLAWGYAVLMALATYTHLTAALIAVGHALTLVLTTRWSSGESRRMATWPATALVLSAVLTVCLYAPMLPQVVRVIATPTMEGVSVEWTGAGWMLAEGVRVLSRGIPGGLVTVGLALAVLVIGMASYWRQSRVTALLMFLPLLVTLVAVIAARHNLWPRFFFFAAGFIVLAALRGGFAVVRWLVRWHPERVATAGAGAVAALSVLTVPRAWQPKQQFRAAYEFVEEARAPVDEVVALDVASHVYLLRGWAPTWRLTTSLTMLRESERSGGRTWVVYTLPAHLRAVAPGLYEHISSSRYAVVRVFPATVGGGEIHVLRQGSATAYD